MSISKRDQKKIMTATVHPEHPHIFTNYVYSCFTSYRIDFWKINGHQVVFDDSRGENPMSEIQRGLVAVTVGVSNNAVATRKNNFSFSNLPATVAKVSGKAVERALISPISPWIFSVLSLVGAVASPIFLGLTILSALLTVTSLSSIVILFVVHDNLHSSKEIVDNDSLLRNKLGLFPITSKFAVMTSHVANKTIELLKIANNPQMSMLVERKLEIDPGHESFKNWVYIVHEIVTLDNSFPIDAIPLMNVGANKVLHKLRDKVEREKATIAWREGIEAKDAIVLETEELRVMYGFAVEDSAKAEDYADLYLEGR